MFNIKPVAPQHPAQANAVLPTADQLVAAGKAFDARGQSNNALICGDMAAKLRRYGSFVSDKQQAFARSLVERAGRLNTPAVLPHGPLSRDPNAAMAVQVPDLFAVMQKHSTFYVGAVTIARRNQDSLCWIKHERVDKVVGKIENGVLTLFRGRMNEEMQLHLMALLLELEDNPLAAAMKYGKLSGRCCSCGRDLTDPESIAAGIGPVCANKFN